MVRSVRGGVHGRGGGFRGSAHRGCVIKDEQSPPTHGPRLRDDNPSLSEDSTQPPDVVFETEFPDRMECTESASKTKGRGWAKGAKFDMLQKLGPISVMIKDGETKVSCENASIFSGRVTWIVK
ncbi:hypothetical protein F2P56_007225 [Juglans regia]|uniref:Uncharacterized protein n=1 Tax=Juglans regia TaxID=51240 RepID=A0A834CZ98_JUGRE|nr:hypothetical protein F2P56_007225 [Juglans regia]